MNIVKTIKKYKWELAGAFALVVVFHLLMRRAYIGNDPNTGVAGKDAFHLYTECTSDKAKCASVGAMPPCIVGRCVDALGMSCTGHPCVDTGNLDPKLKAMGVKDPGGEDIIVKPVVMM